MVGYKELLISRVKEMQAQVKLFSPTSVEKYDLWIKEIESDFIASEDARKWILNQATYEREKDREYSKYLYKLCGEDNF